MPLSSKKHEQQLGAALALSYAPGFSPGLYADLLAHFGSAEKVLAAKSGDWATFKISDELKVYIRNPDWARAERELQWASLPENNIIQLDDPRYPGLLREISDAPPFLYTRGQLEHLSDLQLAIVGSRNPTAGGVQTAFEFARYLANAGLTITSGLAIGIDTAAHNGALAANAATLAIMGTGLDQVYPKSNLDLAERIINQGLLVSEFPLGTKALPHNFPRRNRIVSALSLGCLVVEAAIRSGSLITARHALEQGREVFAIPGSIHNPLAKGCHQLIRQGAKLVETADDIISELGQLAQINFAQKPKSATQAPKNKTPDTNNDVLDADYQKMLTQMGHDPVSVDLLIQRTGFSAAEISSMLLILELKGLVYSNPGGTFSQKV